MKCKKCGKNKELNPKGFCYSCVIEDILSYIEEGGSKG